MSALATRRARAAIPLVALAAGARAILGAAVAVEPARYVATTTRHFPRGELALFDQGGALLFELYYQRKIAIAPTALDLIAIVVGHLVGLFVMAALVVRLANPALTVREALRAVPPRYPLLVLATGLGTFFLAVLAGASFGAAIFLIAPSTASGQGLTAALILLPLGLLALLVDSVRVALAVSDESLGAALARATRAVLRRPAPIFLRYALATLAQAALATAGAASAVWLAFKAPLVAAFGIALSALCLVAAVAVRAWLLAALTDRLVADRTEPE